MPTVTANKVAEYMQDVGWGPADTGVVLHESGKVEVKDIKAAAAAVTWLDIRLAICEAESHFNTLAKNPTSTASGLWQILVSAHGAEIEQESKYIQTEKQLASKPNVFHPLVNTAVAHDVEDSQGLSAWKTYTNGAYKKYLGHGKPAFVHLFLNDARNAAGIQALTAELITNQANAEYAGIAAGAVSGAPVRHAAADAAHAITHPLDWVGAILSGIAGFALPVGVFILGLLILGIGLYYLTRNTAVVKAAKSAATRVIP